MPTASLSLADTTYDSSSNNPFRIVVSELLSAFTTSDVIVSGRTAYLNYSYQTGNDYIFTFGNATPVDEAGYVRIQIPATAATPNLDEDYDWTIYWGTDNVLHFGDTDAVRSSRITTTLNNVRWGSSNVSAGTVTPIYFEFSIDTFNFANSDITLNGDITTIGSLSRTTLQRYLGHITLPADLGDGGSFTVQIADLESTYPGLNVSEEWTLSWNSSGRTSAIRTNDIPAVARIELSSDYVLAGGEIFATFHFDKDIQALIVSSLVFEDATFLRTSGSPNDREWSIAVGAPSTGNGIGRIILPENVVQPSGNNAVTAEFTYINAVDVDIELSAASAQTGETVLAIFNFNYDIPEFNADWLSLNIGSEILGLNNEVLALNEEVLGYPIAPSDVAGEPVSLDEQNRSWQVPIDLPQSGEGMYQIALEEDAIGIRHSAAMAQVQFAPTINLNIRQQDNLTLIAIIGRNFKHDINISGNNISSVDVRGLIRPFYHQWNKTRGVLSILGQPKSFYKDLEFTVYATDRSGTSQKSAKINVEAAAPVIRKPAQDLEFILGRENEVKIKVDNRPTQGSVEGTWFGLDHSINNEGITLSGDVPTDMLGVQSGNFIVNASNTGGDAQEETIGFKFVDSGAPGAPLFHVGFVGSPSHSSESNLNIIYQNVDIGTSAIKAWYYRINEGSWVSLTLNGPGGVVGSAVLNTQNIFTKSGENRIQFVGENNSGRGSRSVPVTLNILKRNSLVGRDISGAQDRADLVDMCYDSNAGEYLILSYRINLFRGNPSSVGPVYVMRYNSSMSYRGAWEVASRGSASKYSSIEFNPQNNEILISERTDSTTIKILRFNQSGTSLGSFNVSAQDANYTYLGHMCIHNGELVISFHRGGPLGRLVQRHNISNGMFIDTIDGLSNSQSNETFSMASNTDDEHLYISSFRNLNIHNVLFSSLYSLRGNITNTRNVIAYNSDDQELLWGINTSTGTYTSSKQFITYQF